MGSKVRNKEHISKETGTTGNEQNKKSLLSRKLIAPVLGAAILLSPALGRTQTLAKADKTPTANTIAYSPRTDKHDSLDIMKPAPPLNILASTKTQKPSIIGSSPNPTAKIIGEKTFDWMIKGDSIILNILKDENGNSYSLERDISKEFQQITDNLDKIIYTKINGHVGALFVSKLGVERFTIVPLKNKGDSILCADFTLTDGSKLFTDDKAIYINKNGIIFLTTPDKLIRIAEDGNIYCTEYKNFGEGVVPFKDPSITEGTTTGYVDVRDQTISPFKLQSPINGGKTKPVDESPSSQ